MVLRLPVSAVMSVELLSAEGQSVVSIPSCFKGFETVSRLVICLHRPYDSESAVDKLTLFANEPECLIKDQRSPHPRHTSTPIMLRLFNVNLQLASELPQIIGNKLALFLAA